MLLLICASGLTREYNLPTNREIVILLAKDGDVLQGMRDVVLHLSSDEHYLERINK